MDARLLHIDLAEARQALADLAARQDAERRLAFDVTLEGKLGAGTQADRDIGIVECREAAGRRVDELGGDQLVADSSGSAGDMMQTIVAHRRLLFAVNSRGGCPSRTGVEQALVAIVCRPLPRFPHNVVSLSANQRGLQPYRL